MWCISIAVSIAAMAAESTGSLASAPEAESGVASPAGWQAAMAAMSSGWMSRARVMIGPEGVTAGRAEADLLCTIRVASVSMNRQPGNDAMEPDIGLRRHTVRLVDHQVGWARLYELASAEVRRFAGDLVVAVEHVGSTAVPRLP